MEKEIKKILYKVLPFVLCLCIVSGAVAPAYAAPTTIDQWAQYDGSGWGYNSSSGTFSWNTNMANSSEFVILSYLRDLYSSVKTYNDNLKSGWLFTSNGYSYPSGWSGSFYRVVLDIINSVNTSINNNFYSNLQSYSSYPLYTYKAFTDSNLYSQQSFSSGNFILNFFSGIASLNNNVAYIANQLYADNVSGSYNARSLLNQALHKYVDSSQVDYTTILNNIKTDTANLSGIKTDTANLPGIKIDTANLSGIKTDTANLFGIKTDTANLSGIKTDTANLSGIKTDIETFNSDYNNINWVAGGSYYGVLNGSDTTYTTNNFYSKDITFVMSLNKGSAKIYKVILPFTLYNANTYDTSYDVYIYRQSNNQKLERLNIIGVNTSYQTATEFIFTIPDNYNTLQIGINVKSNGNGNFVVYGGRSADIYYLNSDTKDYYNVYDNALLFNINKLFNQAKEVFFDDATIAAKKANQANEDSFLNGFTGSGSASASPSDFGAVKDSIVDFKSGFSGGASSSDTFSFMSGDSNAWDWFTQETANDLDRTQGSNTRLLRGSSDVAYDTPLLDSYYTSILSILGGDD